MKAPSGEIQLAGIRAQRINRFHRKMNFSQVVRRVLDFKFCEGHIHARANVLSDGGRKAQLVIYGLPSEVQVIRTKCQHRGRCAPA